MKWGNLKQGGVGEELRREGEDSLESTCILLNGKSKNQIKLTNWFIISIACLCYVVTDLYIN